MGNGVNWLKSHGFFTKPYYPYDTGSLLSVKASKHITVGFNQWDEEWELGGISSVTGLPEIDPTRIRSKNYMPCFANTNYYGYIGATSVSLLIYWYDNSYGYISRVNVTNSVVASPSNAQYFKIMTYDTLSPHYTTYNHDICVNISDNARNGEYEPYISHEYTLDGSRTVHRVFGIVDLGSLNFSYNSNYGFYISKESSTWGSLKPKGCENNIIANIICPLYTTMTYAQVTGGQNDMAIAQGVTYMAIANSNYTDATTFKTAMSGVYLLVELETPFDETVSNPELRGVLKLDESNNLYYYGDTCTDFTNPQVCEEGGTEEYIDGRTVEMPVGHDTIYGTDMVVKSADFGATVYGGTYNLTTGVLTSTKNADGTDKNPPDVYNLTPLTMPVNSGDNYVLGDTNGDAYVKYYKKA